MKLTSLTFAALFVWFVPSAAIAQVSFTGMMGNPWKYTLSDPGNSFALIDGEPNATYTSSGTPPTAYLTVGCAGDFDVVNSGMYSKGAYTGYDFNSNLGTTPGTSNTDTNTAGYGYYYLVIMAGGAQTYGGSCVGSVNVPPGTYYAWGTLNANDEKTGDSGTATLSSFTVTVS